MTNIDQHFEAYSAWRQELFKAVGDFRGWLQTQELADVQVDQRLEAAGRVHNRALTVIDYSLPSSQRRLWVIDPQRVAVLFHEGSTVVVVLNAMRLLLYRPR